MISPEQPPQPNHVVATIENLPAEGGAGGSGRSSISASSSPGVRQRLRKVLNSLRLKRGNTTALKELKKG
ncbi:Solute carrier family 35 member F1 [Platysternon megacephalum]|uniref:Solute carrier family 35 member F1 n=1 Tax=Platysternon megacephalum TaxID=55544 RepID=A0A4D9F4Q1_9SAUR|nr:Solute carrier family 35 member F1 [Platysternon megacephalum]